MGKRGACWADLGSGSGAFTLALADLLGPGSVIHSIDRDAGALRAQADRMGRDFPEVRLKQRRADFTGEVGLSGLDGVVMANALHFVRRKERVLAQVRAMLRPGGTLILVEYNADAGNPWVPWPVSYHSWKGLAEAAGFAGTRLLATVPSRFLREIYSAASTL